MGTDGSVDPQMGMGGSGRKRTNSKISQVKVGESKIHTEKTKIEHPKQRLKKSSNRKSGSPRSPMPVVSSPGVNIVMSRSAASRRASFKRVKLEGLPKTSQQLPETSQQLPETSQQLPQTPQQSPETSQQSPETQAANVTPSPDPRRTNSHALKRRRRKLISAIWKEAVPIYSGRRLVQGRCIHCQQVFPAARDMGTSHIKRHLKVCPAKIEMNEMVDRLGHPEEIDPNWKFNPEVAKRKLVKLIVLNELPFTFVEYTAFRKFTAALNPCFENLSRTTIKNECKIAYNEHATDLKEYFENCDSRISLTGDMWTSNQKLGYFCITSHFISKEWMLHKRIVRFCMLETPHNSLNMFNLVLKAIQEWGIEDKLFSFTLDNASVNTAMINSLRENLKNKGFLLSKGKLLHFRCATHIFNLIVQDGLREIRPIVDDIRKSVKYIGSSQTRVDKFLEVIIQEGLGSRYRSPSADVLTRWNSTYLMLQAALPLKTAFASLENHDKDYTFSPSLSEWNLAEAVCKLLEVFYTATVLLSGSKYPTSHLYFCQLWRIKKMLNKEESSLNRKILNKEASSQDITIAKMVKQMQSKFNQYWKETYKSACIPVIFDPRYKYDLVEFLLSDFGSEEEAGKWMDEVNLTMEKLFDEYSKEVSVQSQSQREIDSQEEEDDDDPLAEFDRFIKSKRRQSSNELDGYLKEELTPRKEEVDILDWWKNNSSKYPVLSKMARDILAIQASTVPSESAFSTGGRVISDYRSSLSCSTVEMLICLQDWFKAAE